MDSFKEGRLRRQLEQQWREWATQHTLTCPGESCADFNHSTSWGRLWVEHIGASRNPS